MPLSKAREALDALRRSQVRPVSPFSVGDRVRVHFKIKEGDKTRAQVFQGDVIARTRDVGNPACTIRVRKISFGVGVERVFPLHSPLVEKIEVVQRGRVRRAKLYYLRKLIGKAARIDAHSGNKGAEGAGKKGADAAGKKAAA